MGINIFKIHALVLWVCGPKGAISLGLAIHSTFDYANGDIILSCTVVVAILFLLYGVIVPNIVFSKLDIPPFDDDSKVAECCFRVKNCFNLIDSAFAAHFTHVTFESVMGSPKMGHEAQQSYDPGIGVRSDNTNR